MQMYNAHVEVNKRGVFDVDKVMAALAQHHPAIGHSPRGFADAQISLPAETLAQAAASAAAVVSWAYDGATAIACSVMTEKEFMNRQGWGEAPSEQISVTEAAQVLGVTRQAVLQRIGSKSLPAEKVGREYVLPRAAVDAAAGRS